MSRGCSSSGNTLDSRGPELKFPLGVGLFSSLSYLCLSVVPGGGAALLTFDFPSKMKT